MSVRHALLALLSEGPKYGLRLQQEFEERTGEVWPLNVGQVYISLRSLERAGLVDSDDEDAAGPQKRYVITRAGSAELHDWLRTPTVGVPPPRNELVIKVLISLRVPGTEVHDIVQAHRRHAIELMQRYWQLKAQAAQDDVGLALVADAELFRLEGVVRWLDAADARLRMYPPAPPPPSPAGPPADTAAPAHDDTVVLRAFAHPRRQEILDALALGPATSAMLARTMDSNTGVLSYHLRELGGAGLIERDTQLSKGRAVYWKLARDDVRFDDPANSARPNLAWAAAEVSLARTVRAVRAYLARTDLDRDWRDAALFSRSSMRLTVGQLARMSAEYIEFVQRWSRRGRQAQPGAQPVRLTLFAFPDLPGTDPATGS